MVMVNHAAPFLAPISPTTRAAVRQMIKNYLHYSGIWAEREIYGSFLRFRRAVGTLDRQFRQAA
jgi:hypothetical protein